jgi:glycosyltransferase involved in cell wall biosynthesis
MEMNNLRALLVIPHYNDADRLALFMPRLISVLPNHFDVLVSDDGSMEDEREKLRALCDAAGSRVVGPRLLTPLFTARNTGKGGAILRGWNTAQSDHEFLAFADADGAVSADEIARAEHALRLDMPDIGLLLGSRVKMLGRTVTRSFKRHLSGRIFATLVSEFCRIPVYDTQCGLKIIRHNVWEAIATHSRTEGFAFDVELLLLVLKQGIKVIEFPVDWHDVPGSKVSLLRDSWEMALEVEAIRNRIGPLSKGSKVCRQD